jgi:hypothetical protein
MPSIVSARRRELVSGPAGITRLDSAAMGASQGRGARRGAVFRGALAGRSARHSGGLRRRALPAAPRSASAGAALGPAGAAARAASGCVACAIRRKWLRFPYDSTFWRSHYPPQPVPVHAAAAVRGPQARLSQQHRCGCRWRLLGCARPGAAVSSLAHLGASAREVSDIWGRAD